MPFDGEENLRPTAGSRYSSLPSRDGEKRRLTRNFSVIHSFARSLSRSRHTSSRGRGRAGRNRPPAPRGSNDDHGRGDVEVVASALTVPRARKVVRRVPCVYVRG